MKRFVLTFVVRDFIDSCLIYFNPLLVDIQHDRMKFFFSAGECSSFSFRLRCDLRPSKRNFSFLFLFSCVLVVKILWKNRCAVSDFFFEVVLRIIKLFDMQYKPTNTPYTSLSNRFSLFDDPQIKRIRKLLMVILGVCLVRIVCTSVMMARRSCLFLLGFV